MRCSVCGREVKPGQTFCQCGSVVNQGNSGSQGGYDYSSYDGGSLNVNQPSAGKVILIAAIAGFLTIAIVIAVIVVAFLNNANQMTDRSKWENISRSAYSITLPGNVKEVKDVVSMEGASQMTHLDTFKNSNVIVDVAVYYYPADQKKYLKRSKVMQVCKETLASRGQTPLEHGEFIYVNYDTDSQGIFFGSDKVTVYDAMYVSNDGFYELAIFTPSEKREKNEEAIFAMFDSFRPKAA